MSRVSNRWQAVGIVLSLAVVILAAVVLITEQRAGADESRPLGVADVARGLRGRGLVVAETGRTILHPLLATPGSLLQADGVRVEVFVYPDAATRVTDEQRLVRQLHPFLRSGANAPAPHVTSVDNLLVLVHSDDPLVIRTIGTALRDIDLL